MSINNSNHGSIFIGPLPAHMAAQRVRLLNLLVGLDEVTLTTWPVFDTYTVKDILAHIAAWDDVYSERMAYALAGNEASYQNISLDGYNKQQFAERQSWSLSQALAAFMSARQIFLDVFKPLPEEQLHRPVTLPGGRISSIYNFGQWRIRHDATHVADIERWLEESEIQRAPGPKALLLAALQASRDEILALVELMSEAERATRPVLDEWTIKDVLGHIADWEAHCIVVLQANEILNRGYGGDEQQWNEAHFSIRREQSWAQVWADFRGVRLELVAMLAGFTEEEMTAELNNPWGRNPGRYHWVTSYLEHEREHALWLRRTLMPDLPTHLLAV